LPPAIPDAGYRVGVFLPSALALLLLPQRAATNLGAATVHAAPATEDR
jgi:hypothetical protein